MKKIKGKNDIEKLLTRSKKNINTIGNEEKISVFYHKRYKEDSFSLLQYYFNISIENKDNFSTKKFKSNKHKAAFLTKRSDKNTSFHFDFSSTSSLSNNESKSKKESNNESNALSSKNHSRSYFLINSLFSPMNKVVNNDTLINASNLFNSVSNKKFSIMRTSDCGYGQPKKTENNTASPIKEVKEREQRVSRYNDMNKTEMMRDFEQRIDKSAFYDNNLNLYEQYLKSFIGNTADELKKESDNKESIVS